MYKALILDFDGTLTRLDVLDYLAKAVGKGKESSRLREDFQAGRSKGLSGLIDRVNLLKGTKISFIENQLDNSLLNSGYDILAKFLKDNTIFTIIVSGNICPVIQFYRMLFGAKEGFCTELCEENGAIKGVNMEKIGKRYNDVWAYLDNFDICDDRWNCGSYRRRNIS